MSNDKQGKGGDGDRLLYCSFCGKSQPEVRKLIAGPSVFICDECVDLCNDIIREEIQEKSTGSTGTKLPSPREINQILDDLVGLLAPRFMEVVGEFNVRGGIYTSISATHGQDPNS